LKLKLIVLDVLKPREPLIHELALNLVRLEGIKYVDVSVTQVDQETEKVTITIRGDNIRYEKVKEELERNGSVIHSVDKAIASID